MVFQKRSLAGPETLGHRLRQLRQEAKLSLNSLASELQIASKYLAAIEDGRYLDLPGQVYARSFVRLYVARFGLNENAAMERFDQEYALAQAARPNLRPLLVPRAKTGISWWRRHFRLLLAVGIVLFAASFFGWQIIRLYIPPNLLLIQPPADMTTKEATITVSGQTDPGARVSINNQTIEVQENGQFSEQVDLRLGLNTLEVTAKKTRSGKRAVVRQILVER